MNENNSNSFNVPFSTFEPLVQPLAKINGQLLQLGPNLTQPYIPTIMDTVTDAQTQSLSAGGKRYTGQNMRDALRTVSGPVAFWSRGGITPWSQEVLNDGGYALGAVIREHDPTGYWVYYQSLINQNMYDKPKLADHVGWGVLFAYSVTAFDGAQIEALKSIETEGLFQGYQYKTVQNEHAIEIFDGQGNEVAYFASNGALCPHYDGGYFKDVNMIKVIGNITRYGQDTGQSELQNRVLTLSNGTVISMQRYTIQNGIETGMPYANNVIFKDIPFVMVVPTDSIDLSKWRVLDTSISTVTLQALSEQPAEFVFEFVVLAIGTLFNYVGDELAKIRAYKATPYYNKLTKNQKQELDQYYISLDETKDLTKVTAPEWLEAELEGKELA